jgi:hypothetical protein
MSVTENGLGTRLRRPATIGGVAPWAVVAPPLRRWWWVAPLAIYAVTRIINAVMMVAASAHQMPIEQFRSSGGNYFTTGAGTAPGGYLSIATNWDAQWYWEIAANGYPHELPTNHSGDIGANPWAFYPMYPMTVRLVMWLTGATFPVAAVAVSLLCGAIGMLILYRIVARRHGALGGNLAVLSVSTFICAPVFQIGYSEGLAFMLALAVLLSILRRRYVWSAALILLLGLTRGVAAALVLALLLYLVHLWRRHQLSKRDGIALFLLACWSLAVGAAWAVAVGWVTGTPNAYRLTQQAWMHNVDVLPVLAFVRHNADVPGGYLGATVIALVWTALLVWLVTWRQDEPLLKAWSASYVLYLLALLDWAWSNVRYFLLTPPVLWPLLGPLNVGTDDRRQRIVVAGALGIVGLGLQWWWIRYCLVVSPELAQVP